MSWPQGRRSVAVAAKAPASQTLSRGISILEALSEARGPLTIDELAARLQLHRSVTYRLLRTLEDHGLVTRNLGGRLELGARLAALAAGVAHDLQTVALPELTSAADDLGMTCFLAVVDGDECVTLVSAAPQHVIASVAQRPGSRHPVSVGAPGKAILSILPDEEWPNGVSQQLRRQVEQVRRRGFATSRDEVIPTVRAVAVPLELRGHRPTSMAAIHVSSTFDEQSIAARLHGAAGAIRTGLDG